MDRENQQFKQEWTEQFAVFLLPTSKNNVSNMPGDITYYSIMACGLIDYNKWTFD